MDTAYFNGLYCIINNINYKGQSMQEIWKDVVGYEGYYKVSDKGNVMTVAREFIKSNGRKCVVKERILSQGTIRGYRVVDLKVNGTRKTMRVHRLVAMAFIGKPYKEMVNHIDGNKINNSVDNLEWATRSENGLHAYSTGLKSSTEYHKKKVSESNKERRTLSDDTIRYIRNSKLSQYKLADELGISRASVGLIRQRKRYADVA
jgi:DNA-binding transcriptional regulator YiaG